MKNYYLWSWKKEYNIDWLKRYVIKRRTNWNAKYWNRLDLTIKAYEKSMITRDRLINIFNQLKDIVWD